MYLGQHDQSKPEAKPQAPAFVIPKQGIVYKSLGGLVLTSSFFLPAIKIEGTLLFPFSSKILTDPYLQTVVPMLYLFGFTSVLVALIGSLSPRGLPKSMLVLHLIVNALVVLGSGVALHLALMNPRNDFSMLLIGPALLVWWPLFIQYIITWFNRKRSFVWKIARINWIASGVALVFFSMSLLATWYSASRDVAHGLFVSIAAALLLFIGSLRNEAQKRYRKLS